MSFTSSSSQRHGTRRRGLALVWRLSVALALMALLAVGACDSDVPPEDVDAASSQTGAGGSSYAPTGTITLGASTSSSAGAVMHSTSYEMTGRLIGAPHQTSSQQYSLAGGF